MQNNIKPILIYLDSAQFKYMNNELAPRISRGLAFCEEDFQKI